MPRRIQNGFTLIELVVVIAILGILAAVALPRFTDLQTQARVAKANAILGSVRAAAANAKATAVVGGVSCGNATGSITMEGRAISMVYCYPQALDESGASPAAFGILSAANVDATSANNDGVTMDYANAGAAAGKTVKIQVNGASTLANCSVTYTAPAAANGQPTVSATTSGC